MGVRSAVGTNKMAIIRRVIDSDQPFPSPDATAAILRLDFGLADRERMNVLAEKNRAGALTPAEDDELAGYIRVGQGSPS